MKRLYSIRQSAGSVLGFVTGILLIIVVVGVCLFYGRCLVSGNFELNNATDAGILAVARLADKFPTEPIVDPNLNSTDQRGDPCPYTDFTPLATQTDPNGNAAFALDTINRVVAQAILVKVNAEYINTAAACAHAAAVSHAALELVRCLGVQFTSSNTQNKFIQVFNDTANANNFNFLNMLGSNLAQTNGANLQGNIAEVGVPGTPNVGATNVVFDTSIFLEPVTYAPQSGYNGTPFGGNVCGGLLVGNIAMGPSGVPGQLQIPIYDMQGAPVANTSSDSAFTGPAYYMAGYTGVFLPNSDGNYPGGDGEDCNTIGVTVNPGSMPHLISQQSFDQGTDWSLHLNSSGGVDVGLNTQPWTPPNSFMANTNAGSVSGASSSEQTGSTGSTNGSGTNGSGNGSNNSGPIVGKAGSGSSSQLYVSAVSCAVVGCLGASYIACFPGGYVEIANAPPVPSSPQVYDAGGKDFFDVEGASAVDAQDTTWVSPPTSLPSHPNSGPLCLFSINLDSMDEWKDLGNTAGYSGQTGGESLKDSPTVYNSALDPLSGVNDSIANHSSTDIVSPRIRVAVIDPILDKNGKQKYDKNGNPEVSIGPAATLGDYLAVGQQWGSNSSSPATTYVFNSSTFEISTDKEMKHFVGGDFDPLTTSPDILNQLVSKTKDANGNTSINVNSIFYPVFDQIMNGGLDAGDGLPGEPSWVDAAVPIISDYYAAVDKRSNQIVSTACNHLNAGTDVIHWAKLLFMQERKQPNLITKLTFNYDVDNNGNTLDYQSSGSLFYTKGRVSENPYTHKKNYVTHYALYATSDADGNNVSDASDTYTQSGTPAQLLSQINQILNGPVAYTTKSDNNGVVDLSGTQDHTFNPNQTAYLNILAKLTLACRQINPNFTQKNVEDALGLNGGTVPTLSMGSSLFLYADPNNYNNLICGTSPPYRTNATITPDSDSSTWTVYNTGWFLDAGQGGQTYQDLQYNAMIDTARDNVTAMRADMDYHKAPDKWINNLIQENDQVTFQPATGYNNYLGRLYFQTQARVTDKNGNATNSSGAFINEAQACWWN